MTPEQFAVILDQLIEDARKAGLSDDEIAQESAMAAETLRDGLS